MVPSWEQSAFSQIDPALGPSGLPGLKRGAKKHSPRSPYRARLPIFRSMGYCRIGAALTIKAHSLTGRINLFSLQDSFRCVRRNRGAAGIDRVSIQLYQSQLLQNLEALERRLKGDIPIPSFTSCPHRKRELRGNPPTRDSRCRRSRCPGDGSPSPEPSF
jgi:hypothetical protein